MKFQLSITYLNNEKIINMQQGDIFKNLLFVNYNNELYKQITSFEINQRQINRNW